MFTKKCTRCNSKAGGLFSKNYGTPQRRLCKKCADEERQERAQRERERETERQKKEQHERQQREIFNNGLIGPEWPDPIKALVDKGISIFENSMELKAGFTSVSGVGSEGPLMDAVKCFETALKEADNPPILHYVYCSSLHTAAQFKSAQDEMKELLRRHPQFSLAKWAIDGWDSWKSLFNLPPWHPYINFVHEKIAHEVISCALLPIRDKHNPRAVLFFKDQNGDLDTRALPSARIDITAILDTDSGVPVFGILARIWDNPANSLNIEAHSLPLGKYNGNSRLATEFITRQSDIDLVVLSRSNKILLNRRIAMANRMMDSVYKLAVLLMNKSSVENEYSGSEIRNAITHFQNRYHAAKADY